MTVESARRTEHEGEFLPSVRSEAEDPASPFAQVLREELELIEKARAARQVFASPPPSTVPVPPSPKAGPSAAAEPAKTGIPALLSQLSGAAAAFMKTRLAPAVFQWIGRLKLKGKWFQNPQAEAFDMNLIGLALSGGGIRSATFSLGILQGMCEKGLLRHVDYLSTVSGGGYIGSWLISWIHNNGARDAKAKFDHVQRILSAGRSYRGGQDLEPIHNLRRYSNYATPNVSFFSADAWTLAAVWLRNTLLNFAVILCGVAALLLLPRFGGYALQRHLPPDKGQVSWMVPEVWIVAGTLLAAILALGINLWRVGAGRPAHAGHRAVQWLVVVPLVAAAAAFTVWLHRMPMLLIDDWLVMPAVAFGALFFLVAWLSDFPACFAGWRRAASYGLAILASLLTGVVAAAMFHGIAYMFGAIPYIWRPWALLCLGPPIVLLAVGLGMVVQVGLLGRELPDASREWLGRLRAWVMIYSAAWLVLTGISVYAPYAAYWIGSTGTGVVSAVWGAVSAAGLFAGKSEKTKGGSEPQSAGWRRRGLDLLSKLAPFVFVAGFAALVAVGIHELVSPGVSGGPAQLRPKTVTLDGKPEKITLTVGETPETPGRFGNRRLGYARDLSAMDVGTWSPSDFDFYNLGSLFLLACGAGLILSWRVDINEFSMQHFYKNRLVRCYLGASRPDRRPDPFIGFDREDDLPLARFSGPDYCGPYPILNAALNLAGANALAWQERKSASFVFTPLYCGYDKPLVDKETGNRGDNEAVSKHGYAPTAGFAYDQGLNLGTAMGISGAAASPNAGYHTSPAVAFLLTLFNVRLGWWLGNPARIRKAKRPSPVFGLPYLGVELFGLANTDKAFVNVSDGGHFENLGIYELVRRRCRYIIVCDGEQDGGMKFEGLANAVRKCRTDFGVDIEIDVDQLHRKNGFSSAHCVVGKFTYPERPDDQAYLLYLKSSLTGNEETDVLQYHAQHPEFPHQSTADQWFDESQFESYRKLGLHIAQGAFSCVSGDFERPFADRGRYDAAKAALFDELWSLLYPPSEAIQKSFTQHADAYSKLVEQIGAGGSKLSQLDPVIFSRWAKVGAPKNRDERYLCTSFLQLMENVFLDLNLEDPKQLEHPHNAGWLRLFEDWAASEPFRDAWAVAGPTYGKSFQKFYDSLVRRTTSRLAGNWRVSRAAGGLIPGLAQVEITIDGASHKIDGKITAAGGDRAMIDPLYHRSEITFSLPAGSGSAKFHMRVEDDGKTAVLTGESAGQPEVVLRKLVRP